MNQTQKEIEIICIDDGSIDNTPAILERYAKRDKRIKLIRKKNEGVSVARNIGIKEARGEYLMFIDGDDYIDENMIQDMYDKAKEKSIDIVKCNRYDVYPRYGREIKREPLWKEEVYIEKDHFKETVYKEILGRNRLCSMCMTMTKTSLIHENHIRFMEQLKVDEDAVFSMELFTVAKTFLYIPKPYYFYIKHGKGLSSKGVDLKERFASRKEHAKIIKQYAEKWDLNDSKLLNEKIAFIGIYTAFQTAKRNKNISFFARYQIFKMIVEDSTFRNSINNSQYSNMLLHEKILCLFIKKSVYFLAYLYGNIANLGIDILRPILERFRNRRGNQ